MRTTTLSISGESSALILHIYMEQSKDYLFRDLQLDKFYTRLALRLIPSWLALTYLLKILSLFSFFYVQRLKFVHLLVSAILGQNQSLETQNHSNHSSRRHRFLINYFQQ